MLNILSKSAENFIKIVFMHKQNDCFDTRPGSIAKALGISSAAATDMARNLSDKKLIRYEKYRQLELTDEGIKLALKLIRKHRLWETFLFKTFQMTLHEIHREAEMLEHQTSEFLAEQISSYLGDPEVDPHGDPIPNIEGELNEEIGHIPLSIAEQERNYIIKRLRGSDREFFNFCARNGIDIGNRLTVEKQYTDHRMTEVMLNQSRLLLNSDFSDFIYVDLLP